MLANVIVILILLGWGAVSIASYVHDKRSGVPTCGYACPGCTGSCSRGEPKVSRRQLREIRRSIRRREAERHD